MGDKEPKVFGLGRFEWERILRRIEVPARVRAVKVVGLMAATYADADGKNVRPGVRRLAASCQLTERTVRDALKYMRDEYLLYRMATGSNLGTYNMVDIYRLSFPDDWQSRFKLIEEDP